VPQATAHRKNNQGLVPNRTRKTGTIRCPVSSRALKMCGFPGRPCAEQTCARATRRDLSILHKAKHPTGPRRRAGACPVQGR
jgi:hypothetical protein